MQAQTQVTGKFTAYSGRTQKIAGKRHMIILTRSSTGNIQVIVKECRKIN